METIQNNTSNTCKQYIIGNGIYEITRVFDKEKTLRDILLEKITTNNNNSHN